jgi:hypothetical protein
MPVRQVQTNKGPALAADMDHGLTKVILKDGTHVILKPKQEPDPYRPQLTRINSAGNRETDGTS